jgi:hypothetical protein
MPRIWNIQPIHVAVGVKLIEGMYMDVVAQADSCEYSNELRIP